MIVWWEVLSHQCKDIEFQWSDPCSSTARSEQFRYIDKQPIGSLFAKTIVDVQIRLGGLIELDTQPGAPPWLYGLQPMGVKPRERLPIDKDNRAEESIATERKSVFCLSIDHLIPAEPSLDVTTSRTGIGVPVGRGEIEIGWMTRQDKPVIAPQCQHIPRTGGP